MYEEVDELSLRLENQLEGSLPIALPVISSGLRPFLTKLTSSENAKAVIAHLEERLQDIYHTKVNHASPEQLEILVAFLHSIRKHLPATSIISTWFDLLLRPALRDPKMRKDTIDQVKDLVLAAFMDEEIHDSKHHGFVKHLLELYLLDAPSLSSGEEALEKVSLDHDERRKRKFWKDNLESTLLTIALHHPQLLFTEVNLSFSEPTSRLQLVLLLSLLAQHPKPPIVELANSPLLPSWILSLQVDNSETVLSVAITALAMLLPHMAVKAPNKLKTILPALFSILGRAICWNISTLANPDGDGDDKVHLGTRDSGLWSRMLKEEQAERRRLVERRINKLQIRKELNWQRLDFSFDFAVPSTPDARRYFSYLYGLWPCNTVAFIRDPIAYLGMKSLDSPFTDGWHGVIDKEDLQAKVAILFKNHTFHPAIISADAGDELSRKPTWSEMDVAGIVSMCSLLDIQNLALTSRDHPPGGDSLMQHPSAHAAVTPSPSVRPKISIQSMMKTHLILKSGIEVDIVDDGTPESPLFPSSVDSISGNATIPPPSGQLLSESATQPTLAEGAISILQREVLLLMNELNFELYLKQKYLAHIGRLHRDQIDNKRQETEWQSLNNMVKDYKLRLSHANEKLEKHTMETNQREIRHTEYALDLKAKEKSLREEKKAWTNEAIVLRAEMNQAKAMFAAQTGLLADSHDRVFTLENQIKETAPKVQRIADYENRFDQLQKAQSLWDKDFARFKEQELQINIIKSNWKKMEAMLASQEELNKQLADETKSQRETIRSLENRLSRPTITGSNAKATVMQQYVDAAAATAQRLSTLERDYNNIRQANQVLREEVEELSVMVEILKAESTTRGRSTSQGQSITRSGFTPDNSNQVMHRDGSGSGNRFFPGTSPLLSPVALADLVNASEEGLTGVEPL